MSVQRDNSRTRGFSPLFRSPYSDQHLRLLGNCDPQAVTDRLAEHYAEGRLDQAEFDGRAGHERQDPGRPERPVLRPAGNRGSGSPGPPPPAAPITRLLLVLFVVAASLFAHALWWTALPSAVG